ncbi:MAG: PorT family protein [Fibrobacter sp.]|nr:PorT family protein [Fibrobacter sp.]
MLKKLILAALVVTSAVFAQNNFKFGAHAAGSFGTAWGDNTDLLEIGWGAGFNVGAEAKYVVNPMFSVVAGLGIDYRRISWDYGEMMKKTFGAFIDEDDLYSQIEFYSQYSGYSGFNRAQAEKVMDMFYSMKVTFSFLYIDIPVVARINPVPNFFIDAGAYLGINLSASATREVESLGMEETEDIDGDMKSTVDFGLIAGLGYSITDKIDIYFRAVFGLTNMIDMDKVGSAAVNFASNASSYGSSYYGFDEEDEEDEEDEDSSTSFGFKNMRFHLGVTFWFM